MLNTIVRLSLLLRPPLRRLGVCGNAGAIAGAVIGFWLTLLALMHGGPPFCAPLDGLGLAAVLALAAWGVLLFLFGAFIRYRLGPVMVPTLVNAALVALVTVYLTWALGLFTLAWLIGILAGILVGALLCALYKRMRG